MKRIRDPINAFIFFICGLLLTSIIFYIIPNQEKTILNYITYFGTFTSIFGLIMTYAQILSIKEIAEETKIKVENSLNKTFKILTISELSKSIKLVQEVQTYLSHNKLESAVIRLKDLKSILILLKYNTSIDSFTKTSEYTQYLTNISINVTNLTQHIIGTKIGVNANKIISNLEDIENYLGEIEGHLKFENHE